MASIVFTTASGTTTVTAADGSGDQAVSIPRTSTLVGTDIANTFTANQTFDGGDVLINEGSLGLYESTGTSQFKFGASANYYWGISRDNDVTGNLIISNNNGGSVTERMRIDNSGNLSVTGQYIEEYNAVTSSSNATTCDLNDGNNFSHTLTENTTFTFSNPGSSGKVSSFTLKIVQDASASGFTVTWPAAVDWARATAPTLTATADAVDYFVFITHDVGTTWYGFTAGQAMG